MKFLSNNNYILIFRITLMCAGMVFAGVSCAGAGQVIPETSVAEVKTVVEKETILIWKSHRLPEKIYRLGEKEQHVPQWVKKLMERMNKRKNDNFSYLNSGMKQGGFQFIIPLINLKF